MNREILGAFGALMMLAAPNLAAAEDEPICVGGPQHKWMSADEITAKVAKMTDETFVIDFDDGCYEAEVILNETTILEVYMDPITGEVVKIEESGENS